METVLFIFGVICLLIALICIVMILYHTLVFLMAKRWTPRMKNPPPPPARHHGLYQPDNKVDTSNPTKETGT